MVHIISIQFSFLPDRQLIASMDLCPAGKSRTDAVCTVPLTLRKEVILIPERRTRTNQRHVALQDIKELRQLIEGCFPEKPSDSCDEKIGIIQHMGRHIMWGIDTHRAEFIYVKIRAVLSCPLLPEENRSRRIEMDRYAKQNQQPRQCCRSNQCKQPVQQIFQIHLINS